MTRNNSKVVSNRSWGLGRGRGLEPGADHRQRLSRRHEGEKLLKFTLTSPLHSMGTIMACPFNISLQCGEVNKKVQTAQPGSIPPAPSS